jgi:EpsI family protein
MQTRVVILFAALLAAAGVVAKADRYEETPPRAAFSTFPMQLAEWAGIEQPPLSKEVLDVLRADDYLMRAYYTPAHGSVGLYVGFWKSQRQGDTIHSPLNCLPGAGWEPVSQTTVKLADLTGVQRPGATVNRIVIQKGLDRQLVFYWYQSHGRIVGREYWSKYYLVKDAVQLNRTDGAIVRVIAPIAHDSQAAEQQAERVASDFIKLLLAQLDGFLPL